MKSLNLEPINAVKKSFMLCLSLFAVVLMTVSCSDKGDEDLSVKGISLNPTAVSLKPADTHNLSITIFPENAVNKAVKWESSDESIATVAEGVVTGIKPGNCIITVTTVDGNEKATCSVSVSLNEPVNVSGNVSGVWKKYTVVNVAGQINVPAGQSLTIEEGVEVIFSTAGQDANQSKIEFLIHGSLYSLGTPEAPVLFSVTQGERNNSNRFLGLWGGIICSEKSAEAVLLNTIIEHAGATTTTTSPSVITGLYKAGGGEAVPAFNTNNPSGKYVIMNTTFRFIAEDVIYAQGGDLIIANNIFYTIGAAGEAINIKSGCKADVSFNLIYAPNSNGLKLSSSGQNASRPQAQIMGYNNTVINAGWRRTKDIKGGSVWLENGCLAYIYNNMIVNSMWGVKAPNFGEAGSTGADVNTKFDYTFYASNALTTTHSLIQGGGVSISAYDGYKDGAIDVVHGQHDIAGKAGENDPKFVNFPFSTNPLLNYNYDSGWDFHLQTGSPALTGAKTDFAPYFASKGVTVNGKEYKSPAPASHYGAFGTK